MRRDGIAEQEVLCTSNRELITGSARHGMQRNGRHGRH